MSRARDTANQINRVNSSAADATAITVDSSENVLIGKTSADGTGSTGHDIRATGLAYHTVDGGSVKVLNRLNSDGDILSLRKDGTTVGNIGANSNRLQIQSGSGGDLILGTGNNADAYRLSDAVFYPSVGDATADLGLSNRRFKDAYLSGGIHLGGTGSANKLEDYEEGSFSAALTATSSGTITLNSSYDTFFYTKIGNLVHISGYIRVSSVSSPTGVIRFTLPFTVANLGDSSNAVLVYANNLASGSVTDMWAECSDNSPYVYIYAGGGTGVSGTSAQQTQAATDFRISGTYKTNA